MAGTDQIWNTVFENTPSTSDDPSDHPGEVQDFKLTIRTKLEHEHVGDVGSADGGSAIPFTGIHRPGSAKVWSQATEPTYRPGADSDGTALTDDDAGRVWHDTGDDALYVAVDDGASGVTFTHIFESTGISDTAPATIKSLQDKIDALAAELKELKGGSASWDTAPAITLDTTNSRLGQAVNTNSSPTFTAVNTGAGANELYPMNQPVRTTDSPTFANLTVNGEFRPNLGNIGAQQAVSLALGITSAPTKGWYYLESGSGTMLLDLIGQDLTVSNGLYFFNGTIRLKGGSSGGATVYLYPFQ